MKAHLTWLNGALKRVGVLLLLYSICRLLFLLLNFSLFRGIGFGEFMTVFGAGLLFDLSAILMLNAVYLFLVLIPIPFKESITYKKVLQWVFLVPNIFFLLFNLSDIGYYPYTLNRSSMEVIFFATSKVDLLKLLPTFLSGYWYLFLIWIAFGWILWFVDRKIIYRSSGLEKNRSYYLNQVLVLLVSSGLILLGARGSVRLRPLHMVDAATYTDPRYAVLILNTPFNMLKSLETGSIEELALVSDEDEQKMFNPIHSGDTGQVIKKNVIIFILESFSKEYMGSLTGRSSYTPFLDSLSNHGLLCMNAVANGKRSIEAMPAVVASIPSLMGEPYITSVYGTNTVNGLPVILKKYGYTTAFFHGATNGSMGFDSYARSAGFDHYFGRDEYANEADADGHWGIWDGPFLQRFAKEMDATPQPFFSTLFTLSSHHPYNVPPGMESKYPEGTYPIHRTIRYTDDQLRKFFNENRNKDWFRNSIFVFVADHTGISTETYYMNRLGQHSIPILFYSPLDSLDGKITRISQQADIMPTLLDLLNIPDAWYGYGNSLLKSEHGYSVFHISGEYYYVNDSLIMSHTGKDLTTIYKHTNDSLLQHNLIQEKTKYRESILRFEALIQRYNRDMIRNKLRVE